MDTAKRQGERDESRLKRLPINKKIKEPRTYNAAVRDPVYKKRWRKIINAELTNLFSYNV